MKFAILDAGAYDTTLANVFDDNKCNVMMWINGKKQRNLLLKERKINMTIINLIYDIIVDKKQ